MSVIEFNAPPTVGRFMRSNAFVRLLAGPVGSGKTTGCIFEILRRAIAQKKAPDGIRHTRWAIVRQTLQQLKMTVLLDVLTWLRPIVTYKVSEQLLVLRFGDVRAEIYMIPLEDEEDQKRLLSMQLTGAWMSEGIEIDPTLILALCGRLGRYPSKADGGPSWFGLIIDTNMPTIGSEWWKLMKVKTPPDWEVYVQPGGLDADAENVENLPGGIEYYHRLSRGNNANWIERYVHARYGQDPSGSAVWKSYRREWHVSPTRLSPVEGQILLVGQDFGRNPCSLICQPDHNGRLLVLEEVIAESIGLELHVQLALRPKLWSERYYGRMVMAIGDPSGNNRENIREETPMGAMHRLGVPCFPAQTNDLDPRIRAVETLFMQSRSAGPAILIDEIGCPMLVQALDGAYRYAKAANGTDRPKPEKPHPFSDVADCLQYVAMFFIGGLPGVYARRISKPVRKDPRQRVSAKAWG